MTERFKIHVGDCLDTLKTMADNSVDSVVCDPPYGLSKEPDMAEVLKHWLAGDDYTHKSPGFMGKTWDSFVPGPSVWKECLRVLKPGGHLLAFAGTRTQDLMALSIRLAGFQIRDSIGYMHSGEDDAAGFVDSLSPAQRDAYYRLQDQGDARWSWGYGSGFPKSLDVSKAIDKAEDYKLQSAHRRAWVEAVQEAGLDLPGNSRHDWTVGEHAPGNRWWAEFEAWLPGLSEERRSSIERIVIGKGLKPRPTYHTADIGGASEENQYDITYAATDAARQWQGWGSALKPAHEPIVVARKPLEGTVAANVLKYGTGALNIDGCRVSGESTMRTTGKVLTSKGSAGGAFSNQGHDLSDRVEAMATGSEAGRWPANLIHSGEPEVVALFPDAKGQQGQQGQVTGDESTANGFSGAVKFGGMIGRVESREPRGDSGSAARFFYCAKTSSSDRHEGLDHPGYQFSQGSTLRDAENLGEDRKGNTHPTVKPTDLMAYLCRLVTPPGGTVLDPFTGSGSTGKAAIREGFSFIGCEIDQSYADIAYARISYELTKQLESTQQQDMFG